MERDFRPDISMRPWGPFVSVDFQNPRITNSDVVIASVVWGLTLINVGIAIYLGYGQTISSKSPLRSVYVWLIWLELVVSFCMGLECFLHLLKIIKPSFAFYFSILFWWCIQVQLLLQIIINRIRIIIPDRRHSKMIMIATAGIVTLINISVFNIWIPARLQTSKGYITINEIWDRIEKVIYLIIDALLNWYFLKTVKANLINNGLQKYDQLFRYNQRIIVISLLMDVMVIAAMSIPNSFVYIQFHPLAYLVKLNIEMTMANLIKRIAISSSRRAGNAALAQEFASSNPSSNGQKSYGATRARRSSLIELSGNIFSTKSFGERAERTVSFAPKNDRIKITEEYQVSSEPNPEYKRHTDFAGETLELGAGKKTSGSDANSSIVKARSLDEITEGASVRSEDGQRKDDSDDEVALVYPSKRGWAR